MSNIPENNLFGYEILYKIEVGLREFLIDTFGRQSQKWWKQRLPPDVLEKLKEGREKEKKIKWIELLPHHPMYYIDFPDLRKIIEKNDNWRDAFQEVFGEKNIFCGSLQELESIRNNIAHNRRISDNEIKMLVANISKFESAIGKQQWDSLIAGQTVEPSIIDKINLLKSLSDSLLEKMIKYEQLAKLDEFQKIACEWWFDSDYLCQDLSQIDSLLNLAESYLQLPRQRGSGHIIEHWVKNNIDQRFIESLQSTYATLLAG